MAYDKNEVNSSVTPSKEYLFIRDEMLQYMNNYQAVRNMMYVSTLACLGLSIGNEIENPYLYLLPLIVIMPSFLIAVNFWKCVVVDSTYLMVFHESNGSEFKWETRHENLFKSNPKLDDKINVQHFPYVVCAIISLILFWNKVQEKCGVMSIIIGSGITLACVVIFWQNWKLDVAQIKAGWELLKMTEIEVAIKSGNGHDIS